MQCKGEAGVSDSTLSACGTVCACKRDRGAGTSTAWPAGHAGFSGARHALRNPASTPLRAAKLASEVRRLVTRVRGLSEVNHNGFLIGTSGIPKFRMHRKNQHLFDVRTTTEIFCLN